jgi:uncharacterized protein (TIGR00251 family)
MASHEYHLHDGKKGAALAIRITPRASRNEIVEIFNDGTVRIRLTASPAEGKVDRALVEFLAKVLEVSPKRIDIVAGETGRDKLVSIIDMDAETVHNLILRNLK